MMKKSILLILILLPLLLFSKDLDLGDVVIQGESKLIADSLITIGRFADFNAIKDNEKFTYHPVYFPTALLARPTKNVGEIGYISGELGEDLKTKLRAKILLPKAHWFGFKTDIDFWEYEYGWNLQSADFSWVPEFEAQKIILKVTDSKINWDNKFLTNKLRSGYLFFKQNSVQLFDQFYMGISFETEIGEFTNISDRPADSGTDYHVVEKYHQYDVKIFGLNNDLFYNINFMEKLGSNLTRLRFGRKQIGDNVHNFYDDLALDLSFVNSTDSKMFVPSLAWKSRFNLIPKLDLLIKNDPNVNRLFVTDLLEQHQYLKSLEDDKYIETLPVNLTTALQFNSFIPFTFSANYKKYLEYQTFEEDLLYEEIKFNNLEQLELAFETAFRYKYFLASHKTSYFSLDKTDLHLQTVWRSYTRFSVSNESWRINLEFDLSERNIDPIYKDELENRIWLISLSESYDIRENFQVFADINNILNQDTRMLTFLPEEASGFHFSLGMKYTF